MLAKSTKDCIFSFIRSEAKSMGIHRLSDAELFEIEGDQWVRYFWSMHAQLRGVYTDRLHNRTRTLLERLQSRRGA